MAYLTDFQLLLAFLNVLKGMLVIKIIQAGETNGVLKF